MADVSHTCDEYDAALPGWTLVTDACAGEAAVKAAKQTYLPKPNPLDVSPENEERYKQYLFRASYYNATGKTLNALTGIAFKDWPEIDIPAALDPLKEDADGQGNDLIQHSQQTLAEVMRTGRAGLLADYPNVEAPASRASQPSATIGMYDARCITNWRTGKVGGKVALTLVVLVESYEEIDGFATEAKPQRRELALEGGVYVVRIWRKVKTDTGEKWVITEEYRPDDGLGKPWTEIPFTFVGAVSNTPAVGPMPLYDLAAVNLSHYRNSADFEDSAYLVGQPMYFMAGLDSEWLRELDKRGTYVGSRSILPLPQGGTAGILQAAPNSLVREAMVLKEAQMAALGARLLERGGAVKTATQQDSEDAAAHSVLSLVCDNVSDAYTKALQWAANFMRVDGEVGFDIPTEFVTNEMDAQTLTAIIAAVQGGLVPKSDAWRKFREWGLIDPEKDDEAVAEQIAADGPSLSLDDGQTGAE